MYLIISTHVMYLPNYIEMSNVINYIEMSNVKNPI